MSFLGRIREDSDKFSSSVPRMASVSVTLECKMYKLKSSLHEALIYWFLSTEWLIPEVQKISFGLAPTGLLFHLSLRFPHLKMGGKNNLAGLWGTNHGTVQILFDFLHAV